MATKQQGPSSEPAEDREQPVAPGWSRRQFLGGTAATVLAAGTAGLASLTMESPAEAAPGEVGPVIGNDRLTAAMRSREAMLDRMVAAGMPQHLNNGDEDGLPGFIGNHSKGLAHNSLGEPDLATYNKFLAVLTDGSTTAFSGLYPLAGELRLTNPQAGLAFDSEGLDPHQYEVPPPPRFSSAEMAGEMVEHYWQALLRDVNFTRYHTDPLAEAAAAELSRLSDFRGPKENGKVTTETLFRDALPGTNVGPYISQFLWLNTPFGVERVDRQMRTRPPGEDFGTTFDEWLALQNGNVPGVETFLSKRRYIINGRDLAQRVHLDVLFQAYFNACLILGTPTIHGGIEAPINPGNPYFEGRTEDGFATLGFPYIKTLMCEVATRALKAAWFQKWFVHRRIRPEEFAGRVHVHKSGLKSYPLHADVLGAEAVDRLHSKNGTYLLPLPFKEGCPTHPSYNAGHATVGGACVTILKAMFDETYIIPRPKIPTSDGSALKNLNGATLTVGGELNKLASNIGTGRNIAGVHWRSDANQSFLLGEQVALHVLVDSLACVTEDFVKGPLVFTNFKGRRVEVTRTGFTVF
ncbi:MAG: phosphoesterase [Acidobacteria bacterium]|nr:MAG: phosphoesterase [Acidobacteriota bacterium]